MNRCRRRNRALSSNNELSLEEPTPPYMTEHELRQFLLDRAVQVIGDSKEAMRWMGTPVRSLGLATPEFLLAAKKGTDAVLAVPGWIEYSSL